MEWERGRCRQASVRTALLGHCHPDIHGRRTWKTSSLGSAPTVKMRRQAQRKQASPAQGVDPPSQHAALRQGAASPHPAGARVLGGSLCTLLRAPVPHVER